MAFMEYAYAKQTFVPHFHIILCPEFVMKMKLHLFESSLSGAFELKKNNIIEDILF